MKLSIMTSILTILIVLQSHAIDFVNSSPRKIVYVPVEVETVSQHNINSSMDSKDFINGVAINIAYSDMHTYSAHEYLGNLLFSNVNYSAKEQSNPVTKINTALSNVKNIRNNFLIVHPNWSFGLYNRANPDTAPVSSEINNSNFNFSWWKRDVSDTRWINVRNNWIKLFQIANSTGMKGIIIDVEPYKTPNNTTFGALFNYEYNKCYDKCRVNPSSCSSSDRAVSFSTSRDAYNKQVYNRGREIMGLVKQYFPNGQLIFTFAYTNFAIPPNTTLKSPVPQITDTSSVLDTACDSSNLSQSQKLDLLPSFINGMQSRNYESGAFVKIHDGMEKTYYFKYPEVSGPDINFGYSQVSNQVSNLLSSYANSATVSAVNAGMSTAEPFKDYSNTLYKAPSIFYDAGAISQPNNPPLNQRPCSVVDDPIQCPIWVLNQSTQDSNTLNYHTPTSLPQSIEAAKTVSSEFVWMYGDRAGIFKYPRGGSPDATPRITLNYKQNLINAKEFLGSYGGVNSDANGNYFISGWTCLYGANKNLKINVYVGNSAADTLVLSNLDANMWPDATVSNICGTTGLGHWYYVNINNLIANHGGKKIFVNAAYSTTITPENVSYVRTSGFMPGSGNSASNFKIPIRTNSLKGFTSGVNADGQGNYFVSGWSCFDSVKQNVTVDIYMGGTNVSGQLIASNQTANLWPDTNVSAACNTSGIAHWYYVNITPYVVLANKNKTIYVYSKLYGFSYMLGNSGLGTAPYIIP